jgi:DNA-nicking Smr family endonuclease
MSRRRPLSDDEQALWDGFARAIKPLKPKAKSAKTAVKLANKTATKPSTELSAGKIGAKPLARPTAKIPSLSRPAAAPSPPPLAPLGRRLKQRVARGREPIDARIDLHGMTQHQAHGALLHFLHRAQADGVKTVLVVTGKGLRKSSDGGERGVLKRQVPLWLALPEFRPLVVGFDDAHVGHGGEGALYVRLRRPRA